MYYIDYTSGMPSAGDLAKFRECVSEVLVFFTDPSGDALYGQISLKPRVASKKGFQVQTLHLDAQSLQKI